MATNLLFIVPSTGTDGAVGFWMALLLLAGAFGGPLADVMAPILLITISALFGPPLMKATMSDSVNYWTNMLVVGMLIVLVGFAYRLLFERVKMPVRLLLWAGVVIAIYIINSPPNLIVQFYLHGEVGVLPAILSSYRIYIPQAIFDVFFTSLVFIALPPLYARPLWYEPKQAPAQNGEMPDE